MRQAQRLPRATRRSMQGVCALSFVAALLCAPVLQPQVHAGAVPEASAPMCVPAPGMPCPDGSLSTSSGGSRKTESVEAATLKELQNSIDRMFTINPAAIEKVRDKQVEGAQSLQRSLEFQQQTEEQRRAKAAQQAEAARLQQLRELSSVLQGMPGVSPQPWDGSPVDAAEKPAVDLRPAGTQFFGLGGGPQLPAPADPSNDPMVVDLRHLRQASYQVQAVETATTEEVPALLDKAFGALSGTIAELPAGAAAPTLDEKSLQGFRKVYAEYAQTRVALAKSEALLKEARQRKKTAPSPQADEAWEKAKAALDAANDRAFAAREEAVRILRALGSGKNPGTFHPPIPSVPTVREETWLEMQKRMLEERAANDALTRRTQKELLSVVPPLKGAFEKMHEGVVLGFGTNEKDASNMMKDGVSCFNGKTYASMKEAADRAQAEGKEGVGGAVVVSFGTQSGKEKGLEYYATETGRVAGDHLLDGEISLNTPQAKEALAQISGKEFDRLVAHSNGATIAEAMIRDDLIRVNELNIVGGDMSLVKKGAYQDLVDSGKVKRVVVWANLNDPVVWGTGVAPTEWISSSKSVAESLGRKVIGAPAAGVEYRLMWGADSRIQAAPQGLTQTVKRNAESLIAPHYVESSYFPGIANDLGTEYTLPLRVYNDK